MARVEVYWKGGGGWEELGGVWFYFLVFFYDVYILEERESYFVVVRFILVFVICYEVVRV